MSEQRDADYFNRLGKDYLPGLLGMVITELDGLYLKAELDVRQSLLAPNDYLHAGTLVSMADTACGYGCFANLPEGATNFTTIELKSNFMGTTRDGVIHCEARAACGPHDPGVCGTRSSAMKASCSRRSVARR